MKMSLTLNPHNQVQAYASRNEIVPRIVAPQTIEKYPSRGCRALSALNGAQNLSRPACWFRE